MSMKTLLIGLDGATFDVLDPLMDQGVMPFLKTFLASGVRAGLRTIVPPLTPPAWTSLMTGRTPGQHGVFDFFRMDSPATRHIRFFNSNDVQCETIWTLASAAGLRTTTLNFPAMFPPPHISGYVVPGWVPWKQLRLACWPEGLFDKLKTIPGFNQRELAMDIKIEEKATEGTSNYAELGPWIELHKRREQNLFQVLKFLTLEDPSDLTAVLFDGVDKLQHLCWRFIRPEDDRPLTEDWEFQIRDLCLQYYSCVDRLLQEMCELAGPETTVLVASDHGFGPTYDVLHINTWLEQHGYLTWSEAAQARDTQGALLGVGQVAKHTWLMDWDKTKAFATTPTSNGIYIVVSQDGISPGVPAAEYQAFCRKLADELRQVPDLHTGLPLVSEVWTREEVFQGPHGHVAPDLTLVLRDGGLVSILPSTEAVSRRPVVSGAHRYVGIFGARGPGVRSGLDAGELSILDIAPTVLYSLGVPLPEDLQGRVPQEIFREEVLEKQPVRKVASHPVAEAQVANHAPASADMEDEETVLDRLRELGYIE